MAAADVLAEGYERFTITHVRGTRSSLSAPLTLLRGVPVASAIAVSAWAKVRRVDAQLIVALV